ERADELVRVCPWSQDAALEESRALLALERRPTAVVASSVELGLGCLAACRERGLSLPDEPALGTFDDPYFGALLEPSLTAVGYDRRVDRLPPHRRPVNTVFQSYALFPHMIVRDNIAFGLKMARVPKGEAVGRIDEALELVGLERLGDRLPGQLSGGQQQRVAVAR